MFKLNNCVKSLKTGKVGIIQATYDDDMFLMFHGNGYEHLYSYEMEHVEESVVPFRVDLYQVRTLQE